MCMDIMYHTNFPIFGFFPAEIFTAIVLSKFSCIIIVSESKPIGAGILWWRRLIGNLNFEFGGSGGGVSIQMKTTGIPAANPSAYAKDKTMILSEPCQTTARSIPLSFIPSVVPVTQNNSTKP